MSKLDGEVVVVLSYSEEDWDDAVFATYAEYQSAFDQNVAEIVAAGGRVHIVEYDQASYSQFLIDTELNPTIPEEHAITRGRWAIWQAYQTPPSELEVYQD